MPKGRKFTYFYVDSYSYRSLAVHSLQQTTY